jgi:hypothetical protein
MYARHLTPFARFLFARPQVMDSGTVARALAERILEANRSIVLLQELGEGFVGQLLECFHLIAREQVEPLPSFVIKLYALARHVRTSCCPRDVEAAGLGCPCPDDDRIDLASSRVRWSLAAPF